MTNNPIRKLIKRTPKSIEYEEDYGNHKNKCSCKINFFISEGLREAIEFGRPEKLYFAVEIGLQELFQDEFRDAFLKFIKGEHKTRGRSQSQNEDKAKNETKIWNLVHYHHGQGLPVYNNDGKPSAISEVAKTIHKSEAHVLKIYKEIQKHYKSYSISEQNAKALNIPKEIGPLHIAKSFYYRKGQEEAIKSIIEQANRCSITEQEIVKLIVKKFRLGENVARRYLASLEVIK